MPDTRTHVPPYPASSLIISHIDYGSIYIFKCRHNIYSSISTSGVTFRANDLEPHPYLASMLAERSVACLWHKCLALGGAEASSLSTGTSKEHVCYLVLK